VLPEPKSPLTKTRLLIIPPRSVNCRVTLPHSVKPRARYGIALTDNPARLAHAASAPPQSRNRSEELWAFYHGTLDRDRGSGRSIWLWQKSPIPLSCFPGGFALAVRCGSYGIQKVGSPFGAGLKPRPRPFVVRNPGWGTARPVTEHYT
jgi:hypothetical protein